MEQEIGRKLARLRVARSLKQVELAEKAGVCKRTLHRLETGGSSSLATFLRVASALEIENSVLSALPEVKSDPSKAFPRRVRNARQRGASNIKTNQDK